MHLHVDEEITFRRLEILLVFMETGNLAARLKSSRPAPSASTAPCMRWNRGCAFIGPSSGDGPHDIDDDAKELLELPKWP